MGNNNSAIDSSNIDQQFQNQLFERLFQAMGALISVFDIAEQRIIYHHEALALSYSAELLQQSVDELITSLTHPDDVETSRQLIQQAATLGDGQAVEGEVRVRSANGEWLWLRTVATPFARTAQGQVTHVATISYDITPKRQVREELRESKYLLQTVLDAVPVRLFWKDLNSTYLGGNRRFAQDAGYKTADEIRGLDDFTLFPTQAELFREKDQNVFQSGKAVLNYEEEQTNADGSQLWLRTSKIPLYDSAGAMFGVMGTYEDITEQKRINAEQETLQQQLLDAQKQALLELSTPIIPLIDQIIVLPLVGAIDSVRAREITRALLKGVTTYRAKVVILDITGVPIVDSAVAEHLTRTIQAARLKGAFTIITGVADAVAETIIELGIDWGNVETLRDLQSGLFAAFQRLGYRLDKRSSG